MNDEIKNESSKTENNRIEELLERNLELTEEIHLMTKKITRFVFWQKVLGALNILIIVVPLILGVIYLPPLLKTVAGQYLKLIEESGGASSLESLPSELRKSLE